MNESYSTPKWIQWSLICLNFFFAAYSTIIFTIFLQVPVWLWIFLNICAPSQFLTIAGIIGDIKEKSVIIYQMSLVPFLLFFGTGGMFTFPWTGFMLMSQISHITMTITWILITYLNFRKTEENKILKLCIGLGIGTVLIIILNLIVFPIVFSNNIAQDLLNQMGFMNNF